MKTIYILICVLAIYCLTGCQKNSSTDALPNSEDYLKLETDKNSYSYSANENINIIAVNISDQNLYYLSPSFFASVQKHVGNEWTDLGSWYTIIGIPPIITTVSPSDTIPIIYIPSDFEFFKDFGEFRIHVEIYEDYGLNNLVPIEDRVSNTFMINP